MMKYRFYAICDIDHVYLVERVASNAKVVGSVHEEWASYKSFKTFKGASYKSIFQKYKVNKNSWSQCQLKCFSY